MKKGLQELYSKRYSQRYIIDTLRVGLDMAIHYVSGESSQKSKATGFGYKKYSFRVEKKGISTNA
jgi:hypothetical protein